MRRATTQDTSRSSSSTEAFVDYPYLRMASSWCQRGPKGGDVHTEHSVVYGEGGSTERIVTREVFTTSDGRILGTETQTRRWFEGEFAGWKSFTDTTQTIHFEAMIDASKWIDAMFRDHQIWRVARQGGTRLVILT